MSKRKDGGENKCQIVGEQKRNGRLVGAVDTSEELAEWRRLQWKNLNILSLAKRRERHQCHKESSWQAHQRRLCQKGKEQSHLSRSPDRVEGENQGERDSHLGERKKEKRIREEA